MYNRYIPQNSDYTQAAKNTENIIQERNNSGKYGGNRVGRMSSPDQVLLRKEKTTFQRLFPSAAIGKLGDWQKLLRLDSFDSGDLLVLLILLLLVSDGDDWEPILALGLFLILGLAEETDRGTA